MKHIVMTGATGLLGSHLYPVLRDRGYEITVLARNIESASRRFPDARQVLRWAPGLEGGWEEALDGADAVIHLAGEPLDGQRWTESYKKRLRDSRVRGTADIVAAIQRAATPPAVLISSVAVGYYGDTGDREVNEQTPPGSDFLAALCSEWEEAALEAQRYGVRVVLVRTGLVLAADGGSFPRLLTPFRLFVGGPIGNGRQYFPWIHIDDVAGIYLHALARTDISGAMNAVAPQQIRNVEFAKVLGGLLRRPAVFPVPGILLRLAVGEISGALLGGQRVVPERALASGYHFRYPEIRSALADLLRR